MKILNKLIANARRINLHLIAIFAITAFFSPGLNAQDDSFSIRENSLFTDGVNLPASPQAWAMNRYGNESIDLYTGTVGVSLPVYTYADDDFTIPVSINYSSDGYRPNIQSGPLGLGWNLSLGGAITREVRGIPDDDSGTSVYEEKGYGCILNNSPTTGRPSLMGYAFYHELPSSTAFTDDILYSGKLGEEYVFARRAYVTGTNGSLTISPDCYELQPDIFHFSGPGIKGRFVLQPHGESLFYDTLDSPYGYSVSFEMNGDGFTGFTITTPDRYVYTYSQLDLCTNDSQISGANDMLQTPGSWRLSSIEAPDGRYVSFAYGQTNWAQSSQYVKIEQNSMLVTWDAAAGDDIIEYGSTSGGTGSSGSHTRSDCLTMVRVCNSDGSAVCTIEMSYDNGVLEYGADALPCRKLSSLTVRNSSGRTVRHCSLSYDVVRHPVMRNNGVTLLKSVSIDGEGTSTFSYYGNGADAIDGTTEFPSMTTPSVDWLGFYNPSVSASGFAPGIASVRSSGVSSCLLNHRQPDLCGTRLGMLRSISYPTGGSATYEYELNSYSEDITGLNPSSVCTPASGLRVKAITMRERDGSLVQRKEYRYESGSGSGVSSGRLLRRPSLYVRYRLQTIGFKILERECVSTVSDLFYGASLHLEYPRVLEVISGEGPDELCTVEYCFTASDSNGLRNCYGPASAGYDGEEGDGNVRDFSMEHLSSTDNIFALFNSMKDSEPFLGGGRLLSRREYKGVALESNLVRETSYSYWTYHNSPISELSADLFVAGLKSSYIYRFFTYRQTHRTEREYSPEGTAFPERVNGTQFDLLQRPVRVSTRDSEGKELSTRYSWDSSHPWLLLEKCTYRDELMMSGMKYSWRRPDASEHPDWWAPRSLSRAAITLVHFEDEGSEPWDETSDSWQEVASFREFNAAGKPTVVRDAMNHETHYSWDSSGLNLTSMTQYPDGTSSPGLTTRWDWIPLVGVTQVTHPGGKVERYGYDSCGRLVSVADSDGDTLARYDYHITADAADRSWMRTRSYRSAGEYADDITYFNGLGYPEQSNSVGAGGGSYDIITPYTYDALLRPEREWLPFPYENEFPGTYLHSPLFDLEAWYSDWYMNEYGEIPEDEEDDYLRLYSETVSEFCPSGRPLSRTMAGPGYGEHPTSFSYLADTIDCRAVRGVRTTDGDGRVSIEWKDYEDRIVALDRYQYDSLSVACGDTLARTLYRYDWRGNLTQVVTPEGNSYHYSYDALSRVISKTIPGREPETYTYDALDRMVTSQDGNQRDNGITIHYSYDDIGRLLSKEVVKNGKSRPMVTYDYDRTTGLKTGENAYLVIDDGLVHEEDYLSRSFTYDNEERLSSMSEVEYENQYSFDIEFGYDLAGNEVSRREEIDTWDATTIIQTTRSYDSRSRLTGETVSVNGVQKSSVSIAYDELGRPCRTTYGSGSNAITESTTYTIQGWTASKWSDLLRQSWHYENSSLPSWTGNITRWDWSHLAAAGESDSSGDAASYQQRSKLFGYDALNRLSGSAMTVGTGASATSDSRWSERNIRYDLDGNILHLERYQNNANTPQATLDFSYDGPKRNGYSYDSNGNITYDPLRCFEIRYNLLNLASEVIGHDLEESADSVSASAGNGVSAAIPLCETVYYADGTRSGVRRPDNGHWFTRYVSSLICDGDAEFLYPKGVVTDFGYIDLQSGKMQYFLRDHLGSVRVIAEDRHTVIGRTDYLPFGVRMSGDGLTAGNPTARSSFFGFSGKENEMWGGLDTADSDITPHWLKGERYQHFGARAYDPVSCIFMQVDPMAEKYYGMTPYGYCAGNPVGVCDPQGDTIVVLFTSGLIGHMALLAQNEQGQYVLYSKNGNKTQGPSSELIIANGRGTDDMGEDSYASPEAFMDSSKNNDSNLPPYESALVIPTDISNYETSPDKHAAETMMERVSAPYNLLTDNCAQAVVSALEKAGIPTTSHRGGENTPNVVPSMIYPNLILANPRASILHKQK